MPDEPLKETAQQQAFRAFEAMVSGDDAAIDLAQAALLIAKIAYPDLDTDAYLLQLDALAQRVQQVLAAQDAQIELFDVLHAMNRVIFEEDGFQGNRADYSSASNSFFNRVLEERKGIPITLSVLYMEIGKRVGIQIDGIALPYHFITRCSLPQRILYIDAFDNGRFLTELDCRQIVRNIGKLRFHHQWLEPVSKRHILARMLNNLKHIYLRADDFVQALAACDRLVLLLPENANERRDRGLIQLQLKHYARALHDLRDYLSLAPDASDRYEILKQIKSIRQTLAMLN